MLHTRIQLLKTYLQNLPPSYLTTPPPPSDPSAAPPDSSDLSSSTTTTTTTPTQISHPLLRSIQALLHRLPLLLPADRASFAQESLAEKSDVSLVALLGSLSKSIKETREMGRKFGIVDHVRQVGGKKGYAGGSLSEEPFQDVGGRGRGRGIGEWM
jgi:COP9 signalosome complex subunit 6